MRNIFIRISFAMITGASLWGVELPAGTELRIRLTDKVATATAKPKQVVHGVVIASVLVNGSIAIPAGAEITGTVKEAQPAKDKDRAILDLDFTKVHYADEDLSIAAKVSAIDNARETVDENGKIQGIAASDALTTRIDQGLQKMSTRFGGLADILQTTKNAIVKPADPDIDYDGGTELTVKLTKAVEVKHPSAGDAARLQPFASESELIDVVARQPFRTFAARPARPSDMTNLMFIATAEQLEAAFKQAGWVSASAPNRESKFETARAIIEDRGYKEGPVSVLLLEGRPPDLAFQKANNTFAARHHLRIWQRPESFLGRPIWVCSSTHDVAIDYSESDHTFIHRIDTNIDDERAKVVNDLLLTGTVRSLALVDRPQIPHDAKNATGDNLVTDGKMAVLLF